MQLPDVQTTLVINSHQGLHLRPATLLSQLASQFESAVELVRDDLCVDAKSIIHMMTLGASQGTELIVQAKGPDAHAAIEAITRLVESNFENDETLSRESSG